MFEANPSDLSIMPFGMCASQLSMGRPKMRNGMPRPRKCAAMESPYGPAPTMTFSNMPRKTLLYEFEFVIGKLRQLGRIALKLLGEGFILPRKLYQRSIENR